MSAPIAPHRMPMHSAAPEPAPASATRRAAVVVDDPDFGNRDTLRDVDEFEDTQPSVVLPDADDDIWDAPTLPIFRLHSDGTVTPDGPDHAARDDGQWDGVLRRVATAVKRVFAIHSLP